METAHNNNSVFDNNIFVSDWNEVKSPKHPNKRNNSNSSSKLPTKNKKPTNNASTQFITKNSFSELSNDQEINMETNTDDIENRLTPIFIKTTLMFVKTIKK